MLICDLCIQFYLSMPGVGTVDTVRGSSVLPVGESLNMVGMRSNAYSAESTMKWTCFFTLDGYASVDEMERGSWYRGRSSTLIRAIATGSVARNRDACSLQRHADDIGVPSWYVAMVHFKHTTTHHASKPN